MPSWPKRRTLLISTAAFLCPAALGQTNPRPKLPAGQAAAEERRHPAHALRDYRSALALSQALPQDDPALTVPIHRVEVGAVRAVVAARGLDAGMAVERAIAGDPAPVAAELLCDHPNARQVAELESRYNPPAGFGWRRRAGGCSR